MNRFIRELRRREVFRTAGLYVGVCWILIEVASVVLPTFDAPEWVIEVLSPRTSARDRQLKRDLYERSGVREYWHLDPASHELSCFVLAAGADAYGDPNIGVAEGISSSAVLSEIEIEWSLVFAS